MWIVEMLDGRTLSIIGVLLRVNMIILFGLVTLSHKREYMKYFTLGLTFSAIGFLLLSFRDVVDPFFSIIVSNTFIVAGPICFAFGIELLVNRSSKPIFFALLILFHTALFIYFTYFEVNIMLRIVLISYELFILYLYMSYLFLKENTKKKNIVRLFVGLVYGVNALFYLVRIIYTAFDLPRGGLFTDVKYLPLTLAVSMIFLVSRTIGVLLCVMIEFDEKLVKANRILAELSTTDHLTKVKNLRSLMLALDREMERVKRYERHFSLAMVDIDHFKNVNDTYGHTIGDEVLIGIARIFKQELRKVDILGRYGGEEFLLVLPESDCMDTAQLLERIQDVVKDYEWCVPDLKITFSAGVFEVNSTNCHSSLKELIKQADDLMYIAKRNGRDRIEHLCRTD